MAVRGGNRRLIVLADEIPVQVDVIEGIGLNRFHDHIGVPVGGKADMVDAPCLLPASHHLQATAWSDRLGEMIASVDAVDGQQGHTLHP